MSSRMLNAAVWMVMGLGATGAAADEVRLKDTVRLPGSATVVRLADVAELVGPEAAALAEIVLADAPQGEVEISVAHVRRALSEAGAHWGRINLSGRVARVRSTGSDGAPPPMAMSPISLADDARPRARRDVEGVIAAPLVDEPTLRGDLTRYLVSQLGVAAPDLKLRFRPEDAAALGASTSTYRFEKQPHGNLDNEVVELTVRAWKGRLVAETWVLRFGVARRATVLVATHDLPRGAAVGDADIEERDDWMAPRAVGEMAGRDDLVDTTTVTPIAAGEPLHKASLKPPIVVQRGDMVVVRCLVGGLVVALKAEARAEGARGDVIPLRKPRERETFMATISGPGEAVVDLEKRD